MIVPDIRFWDRFRETAGALSTAESLAIMQIADMSPSGSYLCMGSHKGKDSMSAAVVLKEGVFNLIDPIYEDEVIANETKERVINEGVNLYGVCVINGHSVDWIPKFAPYSYVFSDAGDHSDELPMQEVKALEDSLVPGGIVCFHDIGNQFQKPREAAEYLVGTGKYEWISIDWLPILDYVKEHNLEEGNNSWHQYPDLGHAPNFIGAVRRR